MRSITPIEKYFKWAIDRDMMRLTLEPVKGGPAWLKVEYRETLTAEGKDFKWSLVCAQDITAYKTPMELCNRITLMLCENLRSAKQDVNILMIEGRK